MDLVDGHFHVIAPQDRVPMQDGRSYTPAPASVSDWRHAVSPAGVTHGVVVQPSVYGTDNRVLLQALEEGGGTLVGVAAVSADVADAELDRLVHAGVRGVRMAHFEPGDARGRPGFVSLAAFDALEPRLAERGLHLELFTDSRLLPGLASRLRRSRVPVVIDHMGRAPAELGVRHAGLQTLIALMADAPVWAKLSGAANISERPPGYDDARAVHQALVAARPTRLVWGSDWPHTRPGATRPDTQALLRLAQGWTPPEHHEAVFHRNAATLYRLAPGGQTAAAPV